MATTDPVQLIAESLILPNDQPYGKCWEPWQEEFFAAIFAIVQEKGRLTRKSITRPQFRLVYSERRRGESKTEDSAAACLADLLTGPDWHRSYAVAADADQAGLLVDSIRGFQSRSPILAQLDVQRTVVRNPATSSELRVMSADDRTAYGVRPRRVYFDELSLQPDSRLWNAMWSAIGKRPDAQMVAVSMAGWDFASIGWQVRQLAASSDKYFFASREGSELAPWLSQSDMDEQRATLHPSDYARFWECRWTEPQGSWITREMFDRAVIGQESHHGDGHSRYFGGVDVGLVHDPTVIAVVHADGDRTVLDTLVTLQGSPSDNVRLEVIEDAVSDLTRRFGVKRWTFESPQAVASVQRLQTRLRGVDVEARYPTADSQGALFGHLYQLFANDRMTLYPHEQLRREALNLHVRTLGGRLKVVDSSAVHQDHVVALGIAATLVVPEDDRGPIVIDWTQWRDQDFSSPEPERKARWLDPAGGSDPARPFYAGDCQHRNATGIRCPDCDAERIFLTDDEYEDRQSVIRLYQPQAWR